MLADTLVARALEYNGCSYGDRSTRRAFLLHQYPGDTTAKGEPNSQADGMGKSHYGCLLHIRGTLAEDEVDGVINYHGVSVDILRCAYGPYNSQIEGMLQAFAKARGLFVASGDELGDVQAADATIIGYGGQAPSDPAERAAWLAKWGGVAHGCFVTGRRVEKQPDGSERVFIQCTDGGRSDPKNDGHGSLIETVERELVRHPNGWWLGSRRINWRMRCADLPLR